MYSDTCSTYVTLLFLIFLEILFHIFPFLFDQTLGSHKFIDCSCLGAQVCRVTHIYWAGRTQVPIFKSLTSSVSGCSISLLSFQVSCGVTYPVMSHWTGHTIMSLQSGFLLPIWQFGHGTYWSTMVFIWWELPVEIFLPLMLPALLCQSLMNYT